MHCAWSSILPVGQIFRSNNSKEASKNGHHRQKLEALKLKNVIKSGRKEAKKYF
jgi:hypothetical protein